MTMDDINGDAAMLREALRLSEERFRLISHATNDALWDWDLKTGALWWGENFFTTFRYAQEDVQPDITSWKSRVHPGDAQRVTASIDQCIASGAANWSEQYRFLRKDGAYRDIFDRGFVQRDAAGQPIRMVGAMMDVTDLREAQRELNRLYAELEIRVSLRTREIAAANEALEAFSYSVSHDLRAPLRHITGFLQLLARTNAHRLDETGKRYLSIILGAAEKMAQLIDALLSFSRAGKGKLNMAPISLAELVAELVQGLALEMQEREVRWTIHPLPVVQADSILIRQVLVNLIDNALKYTRKKDVAEIEIGARESPLETVVFVKDNGVGFNMQYADKLFCVFQRLHTEQEFEGHGVGLANVKRIIARHGGRVWVEAEEGRGAVFYFTLPKAPEGTDNETQPAGI